jgi:hypothetical protein
MAKFSGKTPLRKAAPTAPIKTTAARRLTHTGGVGYTRDSESDLFLLAATNMVGENTFHESAGARDQRYVGLIHAVTKANPEFISGRDPDAGLIGLAAYLRDHLLMRSASIVLAAEYLAAGGPNARKVIASVLKRPDEPAEMVGYWMSQHGRELPMALKRGVADAARRMYTQRNALRYDGVNNPIRFGDVIELVHPRPRDAEQAQLFRFLLDSGHKRATINVGASLDRIQAAQTLSEVPEAQRREFVKSHPEVVEKAAMSFERLSAYLPGGMDAEAWEGAIPQMGVMALVRNLRNFDQKGISGSAVKEVISRIIDPAEVEKGRLFPYQVWAAYREAPSDNWKRALGETLDATARNIPDLDGTLVVIDTSGSMQMAVSNKSTMKREEVAAVMAMATAKRSTDVDVVIFGADSRKVDVRGTSVLSGVAMIQKLNGSVGHATYGHTAIARHFDPKRHKRVVLFTDDQMHDAGRVDLSKVPLIYTFNLAGYAPSSLQAGSHGRYTLGGFSDATFTMMKVIETAKSASWPF